MAATDLRDFLEDLLLRYDPTLDISDGSEVEVSIIDPILRRIGPDPFNTHDVALFIRERLRGAFPEMGLTAADEAEDLIVRPIQTLLEPIIQEIKLAQLRSRLDNAESLSDVEVDALMGNFFESRERGGLARGPVRIYFSSPQTVTLTVANTVSAAGGLTFIPSRPQQITAQQMMLNVEGSEYYFDADYEAVRRGDEFNVDVGAIRTISNLTNAIRVRNIRKFRGGVARETSAEYIARVEGGRHDGSLVTVPGATSRLHRAFPEIEKLQIVGHGDPEMRRDILTGGGFGSIKPGTAGYGYFDFPSDGSALTVDVFTSPAGGFLTHIGAAGTLPDNTYLTLVYENPSPGSPPDILTTKVVRVIDDHNVVVEEGVDQFYDGITFIWAPVRRMIEISSIPGGILSPTTADGTIEIADGEVHIGGHTDYYVAGPIEETSTQIEGLFPEKRLAYGSEASRIGDYRIRLIGVDQSALAAASPRVLVLKDGPAAGAYSVIFWRAVTLTTLEIFVDVSPESYTGGVAWELYGDLTINLMDPQETRADGTDLFTAANNPTVLSSSVNFTTMGVLIGDAIEIRGTETTTHEITAVNGFQLDIDPPAPRTYAAAPFRVFRRMNAISPPVVRIRSVELLDADNAPVGTQIPPRDPVLAVSRTFHNEGNGVLIDAELVCGLVTNVQGSFSDFANTTLDIAVWDISGQEIGNVTVTIPSFVTTAAGVAAEITSQLAPHDLYTVASVIEIGGVDQVVLRTTRPTLRCAVLGGTGVAVGWPGITLSSGDALSSSMVRIEPADALVRRDVRPGDVIRIVSKRGEEVHGRVATHNTSHNPVVHVIDGPLPLGLVDVSTYAALRYSGAMTLPAGECKVTIGRPSIGSARVYFTEPTTFEVDQNTRVSVPQGLGQLVFRPDPDNTYQIIPPYPSQDLAREGDLSIRSQGSVDTLYLSDSSGNMPTLYDATPVSSVVEVVRQDLLGHAIARTAVMVNVIRLEFGSPAASATIDLGGKTVEEAIEAINTAVGQEVASLVDASDPLFCHVNLGSDQHLAILGTNASLGFPVTQANTHPWAGDYYVQSIDWSQGGLWLYTHTPPTPVSPPRPYDGATRYRVRKHVQRIPSSQMMNQRDATGLYYADIELTSIAPGNTYNIAQDRVMSFEKYRSDGYRLIPENEVLTYSPFEVLRMEVSPTVTAPGSPDAPQSALRLPGQNLQINYDRSSLVDDVYGYVRSYYNRHTAHNPLARHLLPHYVNLNWYYSGSSSEADVRRAILEAINDAAVDEEFEINDLIGKIKRMGASTVYVRDGERESGRRAPLAIVVYHTQKRTVEARIVTDFLQTSRLQRFIPDSIRLTRISG